MNYRPYFLTGMALLTLSAAAPAGATELCVKCTGPDANYACVVGNTSNPTLDTVSKFYCITSLAKAGSHASCAIDRNVTAPCPGERRNLPIPAFLNGGDDGAPPGDVPAAKQDHSSLQTQDAAATPPAAPDGAAGVPPKPPVEEAPAKEAPPKTVQEMVEKSGLSASTGLSQTQKTAGEAAKSASTALEKAGSAVGGAAKSSWKCLSSFFSKC
ncbi:hypothetical protein [Hyphomicrobium sp. 802]|uniref:hypothetical protein n=1 Tax=Hyphomicrobium sp. 802 TaxID=1112272 RepID=UPI00045EB160|nr:hypothetical protein [Hyphomicrobium sp. 802]